MFTVTSFIVTNKVETIQIPSTDEWVNKMWHRHNAMLVDNKKN